jgi:transposase, IS5 family
VARQPGLFDGEDRLKALSAAGDPLERLAGVVDFEVFRGDLETALSRFGSDEGRPPALRCGADVQGSGVADFVHAVRRPDGISAEGPMVIHAVCRVGAARPVPDAKTIWLFREQLARAGAVERLFARFDALLRAKGWLAMGGQIVDATVIEARRPRLTRAEKDILKGGGTPPEWKPARRAQIDRDGRWTIKRGRQREAPIDGHKRQPEIAVPMFGYKNHVGVDREHGFLRRFVVTHAAAYDGGQLGAVLDRDNTASEVWADTAYRSASEIHVDGGAIAI